jgi:hypothetical protein
MLPTLRSLETEFATKSSLGAARACADDSIIDASAQPAGRSPIQGGGRCNGFGFRGKNAGMPLTVLDAAKRKAVLSVRCLNGACLCWF